MGTARRASTNLSGSGAPVTPREGIIVCGVGGWGKGKVLEVG